jgi:hypothetical protein
MVMAFIPITSSAQSGVGSLFGTVSDPSGVTLAHAPVRVVNAETGDDARTYSLDDGRYSIEGLSPGSYTVSVSMPCCCARSRAALRIQHHP